MNIKHKAIAAGLTVAFACSVLSPYAGATPSNADLDAAQAKLESLGGELASIQKELNSQEATLQKTQTDIGKKQSQIEETQEDLKSARATLGDRIRSNYKAGGITLLSVLLGSNSAEDLISNIYIADRIADQDAQNISAVRALEDKLSHEKSDLESKQTSQEHTLKKTQTRAQDYEEKVAAAQEYYDSLSDEIQAELRKRAEEEAKKAAEKAAAGSEAQEQSGTSTAINAVEGHTENKPSKQDKPAQHEDKKPAHHEESAPEPSEPEHHSSGGRIPAGAGLDTAYAAIGSPYAWGATGPDSFDCSGLVCYAYGYKRGRTTYDMIDSLKSTGDWHTSMSELKPGDLAFTGYGHVGIYAGNGYFIDAPTFGQRVQKHPMWAFMGGGPY